MKIAYPVIFTDVGTNILIEIPDLGILTEANGEGEKKGTILEAQEMAKDAIILHLENHDKAIIEPSLLSDIDINEGEFVKEGESIVSMVEVDAIFVDNIAW